MRDEEKELPDLVIIDGGIGQLSSAYQELRNLRVKVPVISIAKREEEIYMTGLNKPLPIKKDDKASLFVQEIRDEAHRFAITFHRDRRNKRTIKTELTDIKGIGPATAELLLKELGSASAVSDAQRDTLEKLIGKKRTELLIRHFTESNESI